MADKGRTLTDMAEWQALEAHYREIRDVHLRDLFRDDPERGRTMSMEAAGLYLDYAKNRITRETLEKLTALARACGLREAVDDMFAGRKINRTEDRAVLHIALRNRSNRPLEPSDSG
jgi:glucose-6-phosphate isomerase